jgi:hypothetical protein
MTLKAYNNNPKITDSVVFTIETPGVDGCFDSNPYKIDKITIFFAERDFIKSNWGEYEKVNYDNVLVNQLKEAQILACDNPTEVNLFAVSQLQTELMATANKNTFYYKDSVCVLDLGSSSNPVWISTDQENSPLVLIEEDEDGNAQFGHYEFTWEPVGRNKEGDYFICWTWTPLPAGDSLSSHLPFHLDGDPRAVTSIPTHITPEDKYEVLLERYLPEMYKVLIADKDITPMTLEKFNSAVGKGFRLIENLANQIIDLYDANVVHESLLVYLGNLFNLRLKSNDPTLWRRQIKEAIRTFKKKGTWGGLQDAFSQAGMSVTKFTQLWQVTSKYTWQESFKVIDSPTFTLKKLVIRPIDPENFNIWIRRANTTSYVLVDNDCVTFEDDDCNFVSKFTWVGDMLSTAPIYLYEGDYIRILYQYATIPTSEQAIENYIRTLPLSDLRDETLQDYPIKNWNVRLIEEDDTLFSAVIPTLHPFHKDIIFGKIRTEFPYSENIYNMEEYNGSTRDSKEPCNIDKDFVDPCGACISSKYIIDVDVDLLCDERIDEIRDILREYTPFHSVPHSVNYQGFVQDLMRPPIEKIDVLINYSRTDFVLSGNANPYFTRVAKDGLTTWRLNRDDLATESTVVSNKLGTAYNEFVAFVSPHVNLKTLGIIKEKHILEVLSPSINSGNYTLNQIDEYTALVNETVGEPLSQTMFTFSLSNILYTGVIAIIHQDDKFSFNDENVDFTVLGVKTQWDVDNTVGYSGSAWQIKIGGDFYDIIDIIDGQLLLADPSKLLPTSDTTGITYILFNENNEQITNSDTGILSVTRRGRVDLNDPGIIDINNYVKLENHYLVYNNIEYSINGIYGNDFYIDDYADGEAIGVEVSLRHRLVEENVGYFNYKGLKLQTDTDHEAEFGIVNGRNPTVSIDEIVEDNKFKENFLIQIVNDIYRISDIDANTITLAGLSQDWMTLNAGGSLVRYNVLQFSKNSADTQFLHFSELGRNGKDVIVQEIASSETDDVAVSALSINGGNVVQENVSQHENISYIIEYKNGKTIKEAL